MTEERNSRSVSERPERFLLPVGREPHCGHLHIRVTAKQCPEIVDEGVLWFYAIQPVGYAAELGIEAVDGKRRILNPWEWQAMRQTQANNKATIPHTRMMGTVIANDGQNLQPVAHELMLWDAQTSSHLLFYAVVTEVAVHARQGSECCQFHRLPCRWHVGSVVTAEVFHDKVVLRPLKGSTQTFHVFLVYVRAAKQFGLHKPERSVFHREVLNHLCAYGHLDGLDGTKEQRLQVVIKSIERQCRGEVTPLPEVVPTAVCLHQTPVGCQPKVTDSLQDTYGLFLIIKISPRFFRISICSARVMGCLVYSIDLYIKNRPALVRWSSGSVAGTLRGQRYDF